MAATATKASQALPERSRPPAAMTASTEATRTPVPTHDRTTSLSARSCSSSSPLVDVGAAHARPPVAERLHADRLHRDVMGVRRELLDELALQVRGGAAARIDESEPAVADVLHLELALAGHAPTGQAQPETLHREPRVPPRARVRVVAAAVVEALVAGADQEVGGAAVRWEGGHSVVQAHLQAHAAGKLDLGHA